MQGGITGFPIELKTAPEVPSNGPLRSSGITFFDGMDNGFVLAPKAPEIRVQLLGTHSAKPIALPRDQDAAEHVEDPREIGIPRRVENRPMKRQVFLGALIGVVLRGLDAAEAPPQIIEIRVAPSRGRKAGRFRLDSHSKFEQTQYVVQRIVRRQDGERSWRLTIGDEHAEPLSADDKTARAQSGKRLAHDRSADARRRHDRLLARQTLAKRKVPILDLRGKPIDESASEVPCGHDGRTHRVHAIFHHLGPSDMVRAERTRAACVL